MTTEREFLDSYSPEPFERPSIAVDIALVTVLDDGPWVLVIQREQHPHKGTWQLPGGFVHINESLDEAAARVLAEKSGVTDVYTEQLYTFGDVNRDPRTRVITVAYYALVDSTHLTTRGVTGSMARIVVPWKGETGGPVGLEGDEGQLDTAFDHDQIIGMAVKRLRGKLNYAPVGYELLPAEFTLLDLQRIHEAILGVTLNKDSFRRRMLASGDLELTGDRQTDVGHRPAALYRHKAGTT
jgi:8-oxo-dGTP diphosphatase